jgi:hypothetical protein
MIASHDSGAERDQEILRASTTVTILDKRLLRPRGLMTDEMGDGKCTTKRSKKQKTKQRDLSTRKCHPDILRYLAYQGYQETWTVGHNYLALVLRMPHFQFHLLCPACYRGSI